MTTDEEYKKQYFIEYQKLGGKKSEDEYIHNCDIFLEETMDIFCFGIMDRYNSRQEALRAVQKGLKISRKEILLIYHSIDEVTSYT